MSETLRRTIHPETKVIDAKSGMVEYVASDETLDHHREVVKASGWRFTHFKRNAPFVDSHEYDSIDKQLGKVVDFKVKNGRLIETVQWAIDVEENKLARLGFKMTAEGYLKAVSVGFYPLKTVSRWRTGEEYNAFKDEVSSLGLDVDDPPDRIYLEQEQMELSAVILGANPNALTRIAKAYHQQVLSDDDLDTLSHIQFTHEQTVKAAARSKSGVDEQAARQRGRFMDAFEQTINRIKSL